MHLVQLTLCPGIAAQTFSYDFMLVLHDGCSNQFVKDVLIKT